MGTWARLRSSTSSTPAIVLWAAVRVVGVISSDTPSCANVAASQGTTPPKSSSSARCERPAHEVMHLSEDPSWQRTPSLLSTQVELVEKVRFGLEVGKESRLQRLPFLAMPAVGALNLVYR